MCEFSMVKHGPLWVLLASSALILSEAQDPCAAAPTPSLRIVCQHIQQWDTEARKAPAKKKVMPPGIPGTKAMAAEFSPIASNMYQCMDIACLCVFFRGTGGNNCVVGNGIPLRKALRKEIRMLTDDERSRVFKAYRTIKENGEYDRLARVHSQFANSGAAHSGPAFLPWHREFMKRFEIALRQVDPTVALPYWDSTLDQNLPDIKGSVLWTSELAGDSPGGQLTDGPFRSWRTLEGAANVKRDIGKQGKGFDENEINFLMRQTTVAQLLAYSAPKQGCPARADFNCLEYTHGNVHLLVGGDMFDTPTAANDPIFWMHHSFVDLLWEMWRVAKQNRYERETQYPTDNVQCSSEHHFAQGFMAPFTPLKNTDGLSNMYTDNMYGFAPRPSCNNGPDCGSKYLFCDRSHGAPRCASKIRPSGNCTGFAQGEAMCYGGICQGGRCVKTDTKVPAPQVPITPVKPVVPPSPDCFNENECCSVWSSRSECNANPMYMNTWCKASCGVCRPNYNINQECSDRHDNCQKWSSSGECTRNPLWMSENCRQSCNKCGVTRAQTCGGGGGVAATTQPPTPAPPPQNNEVNNVHGCASPGCFNENQCCSTWAMQGECNRNSVWMRCNCKIACKMCNPNFNPDACADFHVSCRTWALSGECNRNRDWMSENCRRSCNTCYSFQQLSVSCPRRNGRSVIKDLLFINM